MNILNRILVSLMILLTFVVVTIVFAVPSESLTVIKNTADSALQTLGRIRPEFIIPFRALLVLCAMFLDALLIALLVLELRGPAKRNIRIRRVGGGEVIVTADSIAERVRYHVDQLADVVGVKVQVKPRSGGVELDLQVKTGADVNVPEKAEQILQVAKQVVEDKMGLALAGNPRVHVEVTPTPSLAARTTSNRPSTPPPGQDEPGAS